MKLFTALLFLAIGIHASDDFPMLRSLQAVSLDKSRVRNCNPQNPCDVCQGDCDDDEDCAGDLICFQKGKTNIEAEGVVPGCEGTDKSRTDFCTTPGSVEEEAPVGCPRDIFPCKDGSTVTRDPNLNCDFPECPEPSELPEPNGFEAGMTAEIAGMWVGDEKYNFEGDILDYCSNAFFQPATSGKNFLSWHGSFLENSTDTCEDMGVNPITGGVNNDLYHATAVESYLLGVGYKACLTEVDCDYDVTTSEGFEEYDVVAKSCGVHLKENLLAGGYDCELYQINRVEKVGEGDVVETLDVAILTYGGVWTGGFANFTCPNKPTFDLEELMEDPLALGTTRFVRQLGYGSMALTNLTDWECTV